MSVNNLAIEDVRLLLNEVHEQATKECARKHNTLKTDVNNTGALTEHSSESYKKEWDRNGKCSLNQIIYSLHLFSPLLVFLDGPIRD